MLKVLHPLVAAALAGLLAASVCAQTPPASPPAANKTDNAEPGPLAPLAWFHGCWGGVVNQRDFREQWLPLTGDTMVGISQTTLRGKTVDFEYLRLESRPEGVFYVATQADKSEAAFRLSARTTAGGDELFTFVNAAPAVEYPQRIIYRRGSEGWLYVTVEGKVRGIDKQVIFPMRRVDCQTGAIVGN
jgi:hypothetical protein